MDMEKSVLRRRVKIAENRIKLRADAALVSAYHVAKGLSESLNSIDHGNSHFSETEKDAIRAAHKNAAEAFAALNKIIVDLGNQHPERALHEQQHTQAPRLVRGHAPTPQLGY